MEGFARATGLAGSAQPQRYLWTDAFAVCNFLGLHGLTGKPAYLEYALQLVNQVHHVLGRHRADDARGGWISGLDEEEGERHPTRGGLRIGKRLPERGPGEPYDARAEWDRDGQYFHYLTQWMHALHRVAEATGNRVFSDWGIELAQTAHAAFTRPRTAAGTGRLVWKMSIDLKQVLVPSMGQHDALDAVVAYLELRQGKAVLDREVAEARRLSAAGGFATDDALGIGALLADSCRLAALVRRTGIAEEELLARLLLDARTSLDAFAENASLRAPAPSRLAFRELGLSIGLHLAAQWQAAGNIDRSLQGPLADVMRHESMATAIDAFWSDPRNRQAIAWTEHQHINDVMLATSLQPQGYLGT